METYQIIIGLIALLAILIWLFLHTFGGRGATRDSMKSKYERLIEERLPERECLFRLLSTRTGWKKLPQDFLQELTGRLGDWERIADFIHLSERAGLEREQYSRIAQNDPAMQDPNIAMRAVALALTRDYRLSRKPSKSQGESETALRLALLIAPDDGCVALRLAVYHYFMEHYREAIPLFERGLKLVADDIAKFQRLEAVLSSHEIGLPAEVFGADDEMQAFISDGESLYELCKQEVGEAKLNAKARDQDDQLLAEAGLTGASAEDIRSMARISDETYEITGDYGEVLEALGTEGYGLVYPLSRLPYPKSVIRAALNDARQKTPEQFAEPIETGLLCLDRFVPDEDIPEKLDTDEGIEKALEALRREHARN